MNRRAIAAITLIAWSALAHAQVNPPPPTNPPSNIAPTPPPPRPNLQFPAPPPPPPAPPTPTAAEISADLLAWADQAKRLIEETTGEKFTTDIAVKSASVEELAQVIAASIQADMIAASPTRADGKSMSELEIRVRATAGVLKVAQRTFGVFTHEQKAVYIVPENAQQYAKKYGWSPETTYRVPRLAMLHELTHALQDQKAGLSTRLDGAKGEPRACLNCIAEGHAVWTTDAAAAKLEWTTANALLWSVVTGMQSDDETKPKSDGAASPKPPAPPTLRLAPTAEIYTLGRAFMSHHAAAVEDPALRPARLWAILRTPPTSLDRIRKPETYTLPSEPPAKP